MNEHIEQLDNKNEQSDEIIDAEFIERPKGEYDDPDIVNIAVKNEQQKDNEQISRVRKELSIQDLWDARSERTDPLEKPTAQVETISADNNNEGFTLLDEDTIPQPVRKLPYVDTSKDPLATYKDTEILHTQAASLEESIDVNLVKLSPYDSNQLMEVTFPSGVAVLRVDQLREQLKNTQAELYRENVSQGDISIWLKNIPSDVKPYNQPKPRSFLKKLSNWSSTGKFE